MTLDRGPAQDELAGVGYLVEEVLQLMGAHAWLPSRFGGTRWSRSTQLHRSCRHVTLPDCYAGDHCTDAWVSGGAEVGAGEVVLRGVRGPRRRGRTRRSRRPAPPSTRRRPGWP